MINMCYNTIDRHVERGLGDQVAFIWDSTYLGIIEKITYKQAQNHIGRIASLLTKRFGVSKGDRVLLYMPMMPTSAFFMLACARIGAIHSVVFGGLAAKELANRIEDSRPKVIVTASCGLEPNKVVKYRINVDKAIALLAKKDNSFGTVPKVIVQRREKYVDDGAEKEGYIDFEKVFSAEQEVSPCVPVESTHPLYILCKSFPPYTLIYLNMTSFVTHSPYRHVRDNRCAKRHRARHRRHCSGP